jgi:RimJ/RimL family protein N-acetyltransferase
MVPEMLRTGRLLLRPYRATDVDDVLEYAADPEWSRYLASLPASSYTRVEAEGFVASQMAVDRELHPSWAIEHQGRAVGGVNVLFAYEHRVGELGYGLAPRLWGQGLVVEAARAVLDAAFGAYPQLARVRARTDGRNAQSLRVLEKLGMKREALLRSDRLFRGELVDEVVCGVLRSEWGALR